MVETNGNGNGSFGSLNGVSEFGVLGIGKELSPLEAKPVQVLSVGENDVVDSAGKLVGKKLVLLVSHPDQANVELSQVKYEKKSKLVVAGLWLNKDKDGNLPFNSAVACLLRFYKVATINELVACVLQTVVDDGGYIIVKAY